ncbi:MAG: dTMP kinase [Desulfobacterales bacterium]
MDAHYVGSGIEGSGKTTQIDYITAYLRQSGRAYVVTKSPAARRLKIRAILLDPENREIAPVTELLLYAADRAQHVRELIRPMPVRRQGGDLRPVFATPLLCTRGLPV